MAKDPSEQELARLTALWNRPEIVADWAELKRIRGIHTPHAPEAQRAGAEFFRRHPELKLPHDYGVQRQEDGSLALTKSGWFKRNADWVMPLAIGGAGAVTLLAAPAAATTAGGATTTTTAGTAGTLGSTSTVGASALPAGSAGAAVSTAGAGGGMGAWGSFFKEALPYIIQGGTQLGGAAIESKGLSDAAKIAAETADKDRAEAKRVYEEDRADLAPYRALGVGSVGALSTGLNLPAYTPPPPTAAPMASLAAPRMAVPRDPTNPAPDAGPRAQGGTVPILAPNGRQVSVPEAQVNEALAKGGQLVNAGPMSVLGYTGARA